MAASASPTKAIVSALVSGAIAPLVVDQTGGVSRHHAEIRLEGWDVVLVDIGSANGTLVAAPGALADRGVLGERLGDGVGRRTRPAGARSRPAAAACRGPGPGSAAGAGARGRPCPSCRRRGATAPRR